VRLFIWRRKAKSHDAGYRRTQRSSLQSGLRVSGSHLAM